MDMNFLVLDVKTGEGRAVAVPMPEGGTPKRAFDALLGQEGISEAEGVRFSFEGDVSYYDENAGKVITGATDADAARRKMLEYVAVLGIEIKQSATVTAKVAEPKAANKHNRKRG